MSCSDADYAWPKQLVSVQWLKVHQILTQSSFKYHWLCFFGLQLWIPVIFFQIWNNFIKCKYDYFVYGMLYFLEIYLSRIQYGIEFGK